MRRNLECSEVVQGTGVCKINTPFRCGHVGCAGHLSVCVGGKTPIPPPPPDVNVARKEGRVRAAQKEVFILQGVWTPLEATLTSGGGGRPRWGDAEHTPVCTHPWRSLPSRNNRFFATVPFSRPCGISKMDFSFPEHCTDRSAEYTLHRQIGGGVQRHERRDCGPILRQHFGCPMGKESMPSLCPLMPFGCLLVSLDALWAPFGCPLDALWMPCGCLLDALWMPFG